MRFILYLLLILFCNSASAQYSNIVWCFGDSAGIDFNTNPPTPISSGVLGRAGSASIANANGELLFYCIGYDYYARLNGLLRDGVVKNRMHSTMFNGDQLTGSWYHDMIIVPKSSADSTFYIFSAGVTVTFGLWYSVIDLKQQNGLGAVNQKNVQLQTFQVVDALTSVKHGNGRDWWLLVQRWSGIGGAPLNNDFYVYKIDSTGISNPIIQSLGTLRNNGGADITFTSDGSKFVYANWQGLVETYDFDRCTGIISNPQTIEPRPGHSGPYYMSAVFSPNDRFLYLLSYNEPNNDTNYVYQFDMNAANIAASKICLDTFPKPIGVGHMELAPDKKIYMSATYEGQGSAFPYPDSIRNYVTDNLSVINNPDSLGVACDFQPFSFYLGGGAAYYGLPNNPDYTLGPLTGSVCDTLTVLHELKNERTNELKIFYHAQWDIAFINADKLNGKDYALSLYDVNGKIIFKERGTLMPPYFTKDLNMQAFAKGVYVAVLQTEKEVLKKKFIKY